MAILTDIFVSSPTDAAKYESQRRAGSVGGIFEAVHFKGLTNLEFGILWALIEGKDFDFDKHALESLAPQGETWLFRFPATFVKQLESLDPNQISRVAESWANTEELQWEPSEAQELIVELIRLAKIAGTSANGLFLWGSV